MMVYDANNIPHNIASDGDAMLYLQDSDAFFAKSWGVSIDDYMSWKTNAGNIICCARTSKGKPCKRIANDGHSIDSPLEYAKLLRCGLLCSSHG